MSTGDRSSGMGAGMLVAAFVLLLIMLAWLFQQYLDSENDPARLVVSQTDSGGVTELKLRADRKGHYAIAGRINGKQAAFLLDTGATYVAVPEKLSKRYGLSKNGRILLSTANGQTTGYRTHIERLTIGNIRLHDIPAVIHPRLEDILLGMSALKSLEFTHANGEMTIRQKHAHQSQ